MRAMSGMNRFPPSDVTVIDTRVRCCRPLHWAAGNGMVSTVQLLLEKGANILARDENGMYGISDCPKALYHL